MSSTDIGGALIDPLRFLGGCAVLSSHVLEPFFIQSSPFSSRVPLCVPNSVER
jgi:hypothetical protein